MPGYIIVTARDSGWRLGSFFFWIGGVGQKVYVLHVLTKVAVYVTPEIVSMQIYIGDKLLGGGLEGLESTTFLFVYCSKPIKTDVNVFLDHY